MVEQAARKISSCVAKQSAPLALASEMLDNNTFLCNDSFVDITKHCPANPLEQRVLDEVKKKADEEILCEIMCCCTENPSMSKKTNQSGKQQCVADVMAESQRQQGGNSRYRAEMNYDMKKSTRNNGQNTEDPTPIAHTNPDTKQLTNYPTTYLPAHSKNIPGFVRNDGYIRRPDVVVVRDKNKQATVDNIEHVVEMKFKNDDENPEATIDYQIIAGGPHKYKIMKEGEECNCDEDGEEDGVLKSLAGSPAFSKNKQNSDQPSDDLSTAEVVGYAALGTVLAVGAVALFLIPFDGPVGEIAAGTASAAAFTAAFQN